MEKREEAMAVLATVAMAAMWEVAQAAMRAEVEADEREAIGAGEVVQEAVVVQADAKSPFPSA